MRFAQVTLGLALLHFSSATSCTSSNALAWPSTGDSSSSGSSGDSSGGSSSGSSGDSGSPGSSDGSCSAQCGNNASCVQTCLEFQQQASCNILGGSACTDTGTGLDDGEDSEGLIKKRDTLDCDSDETCYAYTDGTLLCLDLTTGYYTDDTGRTGNLLDGDVGQGGSSSSSTTGVLGGSKTTLAGSSTTAGAGASSSSSSSKITVVGSSSSPTATSNPATSTRPSGSIASVAPTGGAQLLRAGAAVGALGLAVGLVL